MWSLLAIKVSVNVLVLLALCIAAFFTGYLIRSSFISGCKKRIAELEKEMLRDNARILELEKEKVDLMKSYASNKER